MTARVLRLEDYLGHIVEAIDRILRYTADLDEAGFRQSPMAQDAVIRNLEVIGEASHKILDAEPGFAARRPELQLAVAYNTRNILSHHYFKVDLGIVWDTVRSDLPTLREKVEQVRANLPPPPTPAS